jgi:hypothetical protein
MKLKTFNEMNSNEAKVIEITFPNGDVYTIPAELIAQKRTEYYAENDGFEKDSIDWIKEFDISMAPSELYDWLQNDMDWADVKDHATKMESSEPDYNSMWFDAEFEVK